MKVSRLKYNVITIFIFIIFAGILIFTNVTNTSIPVVTVPGSYAELFANDKGLKVGSLPDSVTNYFDQRYEIFDYNNNASGVTIENYSGKSSELVIPVKIDGKLVTEIGENFFNSLNGVAKVYVPISVTKLPENVNKNIVIECDKDALFANNEDTEWNIQTQYDSNYINLFLGDCPFMYNESPSGMDITGYLGVDRYLVIPSYINGIPVTTVSMDLEGNFDLVVIPATVTNITGRVATSHMGIGFVLTLLAAIIAFAIIIIYTNVVLPKFRTAESYARALPGVAVAYIYLLVQLGLGIGATYAGVPSPIVFFFASVILVVLVLVVLSIAAGGSKHSKHIQEKTEVKTSWMKNFRVACAELADDVKDPEAKKAVERLIEEIKYSSTSSSAELVEDEAKLEEAVNVLRSAIEGGNKDVIIEKANLAMRVLEVRNRKSRLVK